MSGTPQLREHESQLVVESVPLFERAVSFAFDTLAVRQGSPVPA